MTIQRLREIADFHRRQMKACHVSADFATAKELPLHASDARLLAEIHYHAAHDLEVFANSLNATVHLLSNLQK